jgi:peptidoglycan/LPS O-acetylase OafA/YrhL
MTETPRQEGGATISDAVPRRLLAGDGLRAIAALMGLTLHAAIMVMLFKGWPGFNPDEEWGTQFHPLVGFAAPALQLMRVTIYIFFVLSGYLLSRGFVSAYTLGTPRPDVARYARNRVLRILPAFWLVTILLLFWDKSWTGGGVLGVLADFGFAQNYHESTSVVLPQAWTLNLEVAFYVLIPVVSAIVLVTLAKRPRSPRGRLAVVLCGLLAAYAASLALKHDAGARSPDLNFNIAEYLFAFIPGVALGAIEPFAAPRVRASRSGVAYAWALLATAAVLLTAYMALPGASYGARLIAVTIGCGALVGSAACLQWANGGVPRILDIRPMHWVGERSYGIYLMHLAILSHLLPHIGQSFGRTTTFVLLLLGGIPITLLAADLSWRFVERPAMKRKLPWRQAEFARSSAPGRVTA